MTKAEQAMSEVIAALAAAGFVSDGATREESVRVPTSHSPLYGTSGGEIATFGGRQRFVMTGTNIKATVGKRTTAIYRVGHQGEGLPGVSGIATLNTREIEQVKAAIAALPTR